MYAVDCVAADNSDGERFYVEDFEDYVSDVEAVVKVAKSRESSLPFSSSVTAQAELSLASTRLIINSNWLGLICESFTQELPAPDFALASFKGLGRLAPHAHILHLPNERFSRDRRAVETMNEDPLIAHET